MLGQLIPKSSIQHGVQSLPKLLSRRRYLAIQFQNHYSTNDAERQYSNIRNIGIIAHIDAGKTTTTERMLYYSGYTQRIGNVDDGSTVTDFLPAERARGVTIQSAAVSFTWPPDPHLQPAKASELNPHTIQLIDTPGHADFTFEVQRSLRILDGAICILDGVAGVEAQTEKVWYQATRYQIPKIIYVNKLDRDGAAFARTVRNIATRLHTWPAVCQIPWWDDKGDFVGVGDVLGLKAIRWAKGGDGRDYEVLALDSLARSEHQFASEIKKARMALIECLSEHDEDMVVKYLEYEEDSLAIPTNDIIQSLRKCVIEPKTPVCPVFAGASFKNIGVQMLLDAVINLLPSPNEAPDPEVSVGPSSGRLSELLAGQLTASVFTNVMKQQRKQPLALIQYLEACALAFKVVHDPRKGVLVYIRVYSGTLKPQSTLFNTSLQISEKVPKLCQMFAEVPVEVESLSAGQIGVLPGLKSARTGDTLIYYTGSSTKAGPPAPLNTVSLRPIETPPAVFFASVEARSLSEEKNVKDALNILVREDPSLRVTQDEESGQTHLCGMGEFHLEIAGNRLVNDLKAKANVGNIEISYREMILQSSPNSIYAFDREQGGRQARASCVASVEPLPFSSEPELDEDHDVTIDQDGNRVTILLRTVANDTGDMKPWKGHLPGHLDIDTVHNALEYGALAALSRGVNYPYPMHDAHVHLTIDPHTHIFGSDTTPAALTSAARQATKAALQSTALEHGSALMELYMNVVVSCDEASLGAVAKDLSSNRAGHVLSLEDGSATSGLVINDPELGSEMKKIDVSKIYTPPDLYESSFADAEGAASTKQRSITARVPLKEMVGYLKHLRSLTAGRGTFTMSADRFERVMGHREKLLIKELRGY